MAKSSPVSPRDLALKEKRFQSIQEVEAAFNVMVRRLNDVYKYNRRDHDRLTEDVADVSEAGTLTIEAHTSDDTLTEAESGSVHTNLGATGTITLTLPSSPPTGTYFYFCVSENQKELRIEPGDDTAILAWINYSPGFYLHSSGIGDDLSVVFDGSNWAVFNSGMNWQSEN